MLRELPLITFCIKRRPFTANLSVKFRMHLKFVIFCGFVFLGTSCTPRSYDETGHFLKIGSSNQGSSDLDVKNHRSSYSHSPIMLHNRPSSDYQYHGYVPAVASQAASVLSANVNLLEPFMLVTFLLFVLSLIDKARLPFLSKRNDNYTSSEPSDYDRFHHQIFDRNHQLKTLGKHNETHF